MRRIALHLPDARLDYADPDDRAPLIAAVGPLVESEGLCDLVDACALLREGGREFRCLIAGGGVLEGVLRRRIMRHGLAGRVELLGPLGRECVVALLRRAAAFAAPRVAPRGDARPPLPMLEAMALGTPCIVTDGGRRPAAVVEGVTGLIVQPRDPIGLSEALDELLVSPRLRVQLARAARDRLVKVHPEGTTPRAPGWLGAGAGHRDLAVARPLPPLPAVT